MRKKVVLLAIVVIAAALLLAEARAMLLSNTVGPYQIHVSDVGQDLILEVSSPPPTTAYTGSAISMNITVSNPISAAVSGYVVVNVTTSDLQVTSMAGLSVLLVSNSFGGQSGSFGTATQSVGNVYVAKVSTQFTWQPGCNDTAAIYLTFPKANPTATGHYSVTIGVSNT